MLAPSLPGVTRCLCRRPSPMSIAVSMMLSGQPSVASHAGESVGGWARAAMAAWIRRGVRRAFFAATLTRPSNTVAPWSSAISLCRGGHGAIIAGRAECDGRPVSPETGTRHAVFRERDSPGSSSRLGERSRASRLPETPMMISAMATLTAPWVCQ